MEEYVFFKDIWEQTISETTEALLSFAARRQLVIYTDFENKMKRVKSAVNSCWLSTSLNGIIEGIDHKMYI